LAGFALITAREKAAVGRRNKMELLTEFIKIFNAKLTAWYLNHDDDYSGCSTCGAYDDTKPSRETINTIIEETLVELNKKIVAQRNSDIVNS
jgi:hypothetical protein